MRFVHFVENCGPKLDSRPVHVDPQLVAYFRPHHRAGTELVLVSGQILLLVDDAERVRLILEEDAGLSAAEGRPE